MAYIYAIDRQATDDVAVRRNISKGAPWVRIRVRSVRSSARWTFATSLIPEVGLQSVSISGAILDHFLGVFLLGLIAVILLSKVLGIKRGFLYHKEAPQSQKGSGLAKKGQKSSLK